MIKKSIFFILLALLLIMSGCGTNSQAPNSSASTSAPTESSGSAGSTQPDQEGFLTNQNEPLTHASALGLYESLDVSEDQRVEILDMNEDYIFLSVNYDAFEIELTREVGFTYMSEKLVLLEYPNMTLVSEILLHLRSTVQAGLFLMMAIHTPLSQYLIPSNLIILSIIIQINRKLLTR